MGCLVLVYPTTLPPIWAVVGFLCCGDAGCDADVLSSLSPSLLALDGGVGGKTWRRWDAGRDDSRGIIEFGDETTSMEGAIIVGRWAGD